MACAGLDRGLKPAITKRDVPTGRAIALVSLGIRSPKDHGVIQFAMGDSVLSPFLRKGKNRRQNLGLALLQIAG
jgi:hypothetical protein